VIGLRRADDGTEGGIGFGSTLAAEPIRHLAEDHAGPEMALGYVVLVRQIPVGHEHEQMRPVGEHAFAQLSPPVANRDRRDDPVEASVEIVKILPEGCVLQRLSPSPDRDGTQQQLPERRPERGIAALNRVFRVTRQMRPMPMSA
jgi:hypothetical protein